MAKYVTTFGGRKELSNDCKYIMGDYYLKNIECFYIDQKWYRINSPNLFKNWETGGFITKKQYNESTIDGFKYGIVDVDSSGKPVLGYFSGNRRKNVKSLESSDGITSYILSEEIVKKLKYKYLGDYAVSSEQYSKYRGSNEFTASYMKRNLPYRAAEVMFEYLAEYKREIKGKFCKRNDPGLTIDYSFGIEIETNVGVIPDFKCYQLGLIPLRDGSIKGIEYATVPLSGEKGLATVKEAFEAVREHTKLSYNDSMHIHMGGFPRTKETIAALYTILYQIQGELYTYFPSGYMSTGNFKQRDYCSPLPLLKAGRSTYESKFNSRFDSFYEWISDGTPFSNFNLDQHPKDNNGDHKWNVIQRYRHTNLVSLLFGGRGTVEFRIHNPTTDSAKVINWLYVCNAILKYTENNYKEIIESSLSTAVPIKHILRAVYPRKYSEFLSNYLESKRNLHASEANVGDIQGKHTLQLEGKGNFSTSVLDI